MCVKRLLYYLFWRYFQAPEGKQNPEVITIVKYVVCNPSGTSIEARLVYFWPNSYGYFFLRRWPFTLLYPSSWF